MCANSITATNLSWTIMRSGLRIGFEFCGCHYCWKPTSLPQATHPLPHLLPIMPTSFYSLHWAYQFLLAFLGPLGTWEDSGHTASVPTACTGVHQLFSNWCWWKTMFHSAQKVQCDWTVTMPIQVSKVTRGNSLASCIATYVTSEWCSITLPKKYKEK